MATLRERVYKRLGLATSEQVETRIKEAYTSGFDDGNDDPQQDGVKAGEQGYKAMSGGQRQPAISWTQNLQAAWQLIESNPLVNRTGEINRDYIIGRGIVPKASDPELQEILTAFWTDNKMASFISEITRQWSDYGAQVIPPYVRCADGNVSLDYIDPSLIERVIPHPERARQMWAVVVKPALSNDAWAPAPDVQVYKVVRKAERVETEDAEYQVGDERLTFEARAYEATWRNPNGKGEKTDTTGKLATAEQCQLAPWEIVMLKSFGLSEYTGDVFLINYGADSNQPLGRSRYLQVADYCDQNDAALFALGLQQELGTMIFADVAIDGDQTAVDDRTKQITQNPPKPGSVNVHNDSEVWTLNAPNLNQAGSVTTVQAQREQILGGLGIPVPWVTSPSGYHLATLTAQGDPTWRTLSHDQGQIQAFFVEILEFVRDQATLAGAYVPGPDADTSVSLPMPPMTVKDVVSIAGAIGQVVQSSIVARDAGLISQGNAIDAVAMVYSELDIDTDTDELKDAAVNEEQAGALGGGGSLLADWRANHPRMTVGEVE